MQAIMRDISSFVPPVKSETSISTSPMKRPSSNQVPNKHNYLIRSVFPCLYRKSSGREGGAGTVNYHGENIAMGKVAPSSELAIASEYAATTYGSSAPSTKSRRGPSTKRQPSFLGGSGFGAMVREQKSEQNKEHSYVGTIPNVGKIYNKGQPLGVELMWCDFKKPINSVETLEKGIYGILTKASLAAMSGCSYGAEIVKKLHYNWKLNVLKKLKRKYAYMRLVRVICVV